VPRYHVSDGLVLRRTPLPSGDVVVTILSDHGKWRGVVRKGKLPGGNLARLSLFHDVTVQTYRRRDDDLAVVTQVTLNGALPGLTRPEVYPYAHVLADLADALTVDVHVGEALVRVVTSGLRGLVTHEDPDAVALAYGWHLVGLAGLAPRPGPCDRCGAVCTSLAVAAGALRCDVHADHERDLWLGLEAAADLDRGLRGPLRVAVHAPPADRQRAWRAFLAYTREHVGEVRALASLLATPPVAAPPVAGPPAPAESPSARLERPPRDEAGA
jgi:DNA repair protein RecO (recombination protein O)